MAVKDTSAAFKNQSDEGILGDRWRYLWIQICLDAFPPWNASSKASIFQFLDAATVIQTETQTVSAIEPVTDEMHRLNEQ